MRPFVFSLMEWLEAECIELDMPKPALEWLEPTGYSIAVVPVDAPAVEKSYINGSVQERMQLEVIAQGDVADRLDVLEDMNRLLGAFHDLVGRSLSGDGDWISVRKVEATTPSLREQTEGLVLRYGFSVTIVYRR